MIWWLKARRTHTVLSMTLLGFVALVLVTHDTVAYIPSFLAGGSVNARLILFVPVPLVTGLMMSLDSRLAAPETSGVRRVATLDAVLVFSVTVFTLSVGFLAGLAYSSTEVAAVGRNAMFLAGLALCAQRFIGRAAVMLPVFWVLIVLYFGYRSPNSPYPWSIVPEPLVAPHAAIASVLIFSAGIAALFSHRGTLHEH